ncbi:MAG: flippase-like domain-containing protein [Alphaproteobacteria bacterium]|nr:flippase-like domain-containing protein [Alphaproteobacteria bacterium]
MRIVPLAAMLAGLAMIAALVGYFGASAVIRSLLAVGWLGFAAVCLIHLAVVSLEGIGWRLLVSGVRPWVFLRGRLVRDAGSEVLPFSPMGGSILGARVVALAGVPATIAAASTIADLTLEFLAKIAFMALGLGLLVLLQPDAPVALPVIFGVSATGLVAVGFMALQRHGFGLFDRFARMLERGWAERTAAGVAAVHAALTEIYQRRRRLSGGFIIHLVCWVLSAVEPWVALRLAGVPLGFATVIVIESLVYASRTAAFAIPNAVGVQEAAYVLIGASFGLTPEMALAISLLKRARDLVIGLPALATWQAVEGGRLWRGSRRCLTGSNSTDRR